MCGGFFFLKFSNTKVNSERELTLTHNDWVYEKVCLDELSNYN
jgi:hypothetical protein